MPSFDIVSEVDLHELTNAVDQANREVETRFDFKGSHSKFELNEMEVTLTTQSDFQLKQMLDIFKLKLTKRKIDISCMEVADPSINLSEAKQVLTIKQGIDKELAKKIIKIIKDTKLKVQAAVQGEQIRVTGKKRDELQAVIAELKNTNLGLPVQYQNFRD